MPKISFIKQLDSSDCGLACLRMISNYHGKYVTFDDIFDDKSLDRQGIDLVNLSKIAEGLGFRTLYAKLSYENIILHAPLPAIVLWNQKHFVVVNKISKKSISIADPAFGITSYRKEEFLKGYAGSTASEEGIILLLEPTPTFFETQNNKKQEDKTSISFLSKYLWLFKPQLLLIAFGLLITSGIEIIFPFITQSIVDKGVFLKNTHIIYVILFSQLLLFISNIGIEFIRSWLFIHISSRISLYIISDFLAKLMKLPISFFNSKNTGDLIKRIDDHKRIEKFLTEDLLKSIFSILTIIVLGTILYFFSRVIFSVFLISSIIELGWIFNFLERIRIMEHKSFALLAQDQNKIYELVTSMQEIKLNNLEHQKRWEWERIQSAIFKINLQKLKLNQQYDSYRFVGYLQTILITFFSAIAVVENQMTIGTMLAISFVVGRLNTPVGQLINFVLDGQLAKISLERLGEIHRKEDEELKEKDKRISLPKNKDINLTNLSFSYTTSSPNVLNNVSLNIEQGKTTAIVGVSGSGKTTLIKLLLKFYEPTTGKINIGNADLDTIQSSFWRSQCGTVLQDSIIFSGTIAYNIALDENIDKEKLLKATSLANIAEFIEDLPLQYNTKIGREGIGISQGQKQRILIARAIYKNPMFLFFDEATNALDSENERIIVANLNNYFLGKTVVVVAHRLSTVKNADLIIVLEKGQIIEKGKHDELIIAKGKYFSLIKNQLEIGE